MRKQIAILVVNLFLANIYCNELFRLEFNKLGTDEGLSHNFVNHSFQDKSGFVWITTSGGLNRYDGFKIKAYKPDPENEYSIPATSINGGIEDYRGNMWFGSRGNGLIFFNVSKNRFYAFAHDPNDSTSLPNNRIIHAYNDSKNRLWVGTGKDGVYYADLEKFYSDNNLSFLKLYVKLENENKELQQKQVNHFLEDSKGNLWIALDTYIIHLTETITGFRRQIFNMPVYGSNMIEHSNVVWIPSDRTITRATYDANGNIMLNEYHVHIPGSEENEGFSSMRQIGVDKNNTFWTDSDKGLLTLKLDNANNRFVATSLSAPDFYNNKSISSSNITDIRVDNNNVVWISTQDKINYYDGARKQFGHFKKGAGKGDLAFSKPRIISEDPNGNLWLSGQFTNDGFSFLSKKTDNGLYNTFINSKGKNNNFTVNANTALSFSIEHIINAKGNIITYISNYGEFIYTNPEQAQPDSIDFLSYKPKEYIGVVIAGFVDKDNNLWHGTFNDGIIKYTIDSMGHPGTFYRFRHNPNDTNSLPGNIVYKILQIENGNILVATEKGLAKMIPDKKNVHQYTFKNYSHDKTDTLSISSSSVFDIYESSNKTLWIGTDGGGLNKFVPGKNGEADRFISYTKKHGLPSNTIRGIMEDKHQRLWLSTGYGISRFNPITGKFKNYTKADGLQDNEFSDLTYFKRSNGQFLMGGANGVNYFYPDSIRDNPFAPASYISNLKINNEDAIIGKKYGKRVILPEPIQRLKKLTLSYKERVLEFEFSCNHYAQPKNNNFKYMLEPLDETWVETNSDKRFATYTDLKGGNYTFKVIATNMDGIEGEPIELQLKVVPPLWKTSIFRISLIILVIYGIYRFIKYREKAAREQKEFLQKKVKEGEDLIAEKMAEVEQKEEVLRKRDIEEREMRYMNKGLAQFGDVISKNKESIEQLAQGVITEIIDYLDIEQGIVYILNGEEGSENQTLEVKGAYGADEKVLHRESFLISEGLVGSCYRDQKILNLTNLPADYNKISSGLGETKPNSLVLMPITLNEIKEGVIEVSSFKEIENYKIEFLTKMVETFASTINGVKKNDKIQQMLISNQEDTEELRAQEEEMRQNMEEMNATQEEMGRKQIQLERVAQNSKEQEIQIAELKEFINIKSNECAGIIEQFPFPASLKNIKSEYQVCNKAFISLIGLSSTSDIIGKASKNIPILKEILGELNTKKIKTQFSTKLEFQDKSDGKRKKLNYTLIPLKDPKGNIISLLETFDYLSD